MRIQNASVRMKDYQQTNNPQKINSQPNFGAFTKQLTGIIKEDLTKMQNKAIADPLMHFYEILIQLAKRNKDVEIDGCRTEGNALRVHLKYTDPTKGILSEPEECKSVLDAADILSKLVRKAERIANGSTYDEIGKINPKEREAIFDAMMDNSV